MVTIKESLETLSTDGSFKDWKKENSDSYLCHCLHMLTDEDAWHIGYYNKNDTITTFIVESTGVIIQEPEKIFKKPGDKIQPLIESDISITSSQALDTARELAKKEYSKESISKDIVILQTLPEVGQVYNITFVTVAMNTINIKIDSKTGELKSHKIASLMDLAQQDK